MFTRACVGVISAWRNDMNVLRETFTALVFCGCCIGVASAQMAASDAAAKKTPVAESHEIKSPRDAASGLSTGKRINTPPRDASQDGVVARPVPVPAVVPCTGPACASATQEHAINTKGSGATANGKIAPATQSHAISEKGTGTAGRSTSAVGNGVTEPTSQEHAINSQGTGGNNGGHPKPTSTPVNESDPCHTPTGCPGPH
jgi:hypothetical protein